MNSMEVNKVFAAILTAGVAFGMSGFIGSLLVRPERLHHSAIQIGTLDQPGEAAPAAPAAPEPIGNLLAEASVERGQQLTQRLCGACHSLNEGGRSGVGPNLYGIIGAKHAHVEGFNYSAVLRAKTEPWSYEDMNRWLLKPAEYAPGTRMAFAGVANDKQRADIIAYLRSISPNAPPPPAPVAPQPVAAAVPAPEPSVTALLASADVASGERVARQQCGICHTFNEGGRNGVGPNLYDVVGKPHGHLESFNYSAALKAKQGPWTYEQLDAWLHRPMQYAPGTRMAFAGVSDPKLRADIIAYMRSLSPNPLPLP
jgi:cytochrome c